MKKSSGFSPFFLKSSANFHPMACSRPPEPMMRILVVGCELWVVGCELWVVGFELSILQIFEIILKFLIHQAFYSQSFCKSNSKLETQHNIISSVRAPVAWLVVVYFLW